MPVDDLNHCLSCGNKKSLLDYNYAGMNINISSSYSFPFRINFPTIPGNNSKNFLCSKCINKNYKVSCLEHGILKDKYEYGNPPKCFRCEQDLSDLKRGELPNSFKAFVPLSKLSKNGRYTDTNIIMAITNNNDICLIEKGIVYHNKIDKYEFLIEKGKLIGKPVLYTSTVSFEIEYKNPLVSKKSKGNWIFPWLDEINKKTEYKKINNFIISRFEYYEVPKNSLYPKPKKITPSLWSIKDNSIKIIDDPIKLPSLDDLVYWSINFISYPGELKLLFEKSNKPSLLVIKEYPLIDGLDRIDSLNLDLSKKVDPIRLNFEDGIGIFELESNEGVKEEYLIENKNLFLHIKNLKSEVLKKISYGFRFENYCLLVENNNNSYLLSRNNHSELIEVFEGLGAPNFNISNNREFKVHLFNRKIPGNIFSVCFYNKGFTINEVASFEYNNIISIDIKRIQEDSVLTLKLLSNSAQKEYEFYGPSKLTEDLCNFLENKRAKSGLNTTDLYINYNKNKKNNLLIGLLSDLLLLDKEIEKDKGVDNILNHIMSMSSNSFMQNNEIFKCTVNKLLIFIKSLPDIKQNLELLNSFFPHYHAKDEMNFISEAFGDDIAEKIKCYEYDIVINSSRKSIQLIQSKIYKVIAEIERSLSPIESFFTKDEIEKEYISKVAKYSSLGGQAVLVGTLIATGGATGGIGILGGMLGIRAMSEYFNVLGRNKEKGFIIKRAAEKAFSWWITFKKTLPITIYELDRMLNQENERCILRDKAIFNKLNKTNDFSTDKLNKALENRIIKTNKIRFNEIINGTGIIFNDVATEIENKKKFEIDYINY
ncbi:hypothetical protein DSCO28_02770 [Desulfosarcina ovata subsp. sediminis]|uniref:Uncharacterized protein n=1 Tax=Desulfosarcina ovata subsp. sediminis TaxID=885957 RepID=A0A5K7ZFK3_9BACT|nr:hypothetical protein [Desulfosarcina ovata]BBO79711.1 hypothetical protein DSCO28_02770 [Desulfosarcina ovata subsp. sediminis]